MLKKPYGNWRDAVFRNTLCQKCAYDMQNGDHCTNSKIDCGNCEHISEKDGHCVCMCRAGFFERLLHRCKYFKENKD